MALVKHISSNLDIERGIHIPPRAQDPVLLTLGQEGTHALSVRAKALVFSDPQSKHLLEDLKRVAPSDAPILILGETGTGKELVARHAHLLSGRAGPFLAVNCGAITESLAESELFGHEAGAFTGATSRREGWFEAAHKGTLFLDEIGDLPLAMQVKLLRVLQEREVVRIGARKPTPVDVRLVTATNIDLNDAVSAGRFRLDLLYRINIVQMALPPLRDRPGDILPLARHFLGVYSKRLALPEPVIGKEAGEALLRHSWIGNIRELENVIHFALLVASDYEIRPEHLKLAGGAPHAAAGASTPVSPQENVRRAVNLLLDDGAPNLFEGLEQAVVETAFRHSGFNQVRAAAALGISRNVLRTLLKKHKMLGASEVTRG
jgi:DNA-binding NtrC family response regulator